MLLITRRLRPMARAVEVVVVIMKHGGSHIVDFLDLRHVVPRRMRRRRPRTDFPSRIRHAIEELGPTFIKLAQVVSTRPDLGLPPRYLDELAKLQDTAHPVAFDKIRLVVEQELGRPLTQVFRFFSETPLAAASLGQAHGAVLADGTPVVVKVQRPGIPGVIQRDMEAIRWLAERGMQRSERARVLNLVDLVEEFDLTTREELDYTREGRNMDRLRENLQHHRRVHVPTVYWELTTHRVLTQERIHGAKITDVERLRERGIDAVEAARTLGDAFMQQVFLDGLFHADPHPGNIVVTDEGIVTLLDFGMVARMDASMRDSITRLLIAFVEEDSRAFADQILDLGRPLDDVDRKRFTADADRMLRRFYDLPARDVNIGELLNNTLRLCTKHLIEMPSNFGLLVKVLISLDGITKRLDPDYSYLNTARRFLGRALNERMSWDSLSLDLSQAIVDSKRFFLNIPLRSSQILTKLADGEFRVNLEHRGVDELTRHLDRIGNRIAYSLVVAALLMGSGLFVMAEVPPYIRGYPVIGVATFIAAMAMGIWLLVAILRSGSLR